VPAIAPVLRSNNHDSIMTQLDNYICDTEHRSYWKIFSSDGRIITSRELGHLSNISWQISPDGRYVSYVERDTGQITVWYDNQWRQIEDVTYATALVWGQTIWHQLNFSG